jgi:hypothetical protein
VGLGKTASTYLQNKVFPMLKGVYYIHPTKYRRYQSIIESTNEEKYFVSREMDQQLEREVKKFSTLYPQATPIIVLRSNESWIASQYKRFLKNGYPYTFKEFFDIDNNNGFWKIHDAAFYPKLQILEKYFHQKPVVLLYEDLRQHPFQFIDRIANCMGATYNPNEIPLEPHHTSYEEKQLKVMLLVSKYIFSKNPKYTGSRFNTWIRRRSRMLSCYIILYSAFLVPESMVSKIELISKEELEKIRNYYKTDWESCLNYARNI